MAFLFAAVLIAAPLALHLRGVGAAGLSLTVSAIYGLTVGVIAALLSIHAGSGLDLLARLTMVPQGIDRSYLDTYYVAANLKFLAKPALLFGSIGLILWVLTRWQALRYQRIAKALFWVLHLCVLAMPFVVLLITRHAMPRRYIDYEEAMALPMAVNSALAGTAALAFLLMVALMLWSIVAKLARA
ncbi:MAG: hypothetical protein QNL92_01080 [Octadecabacter sp.]